MSKHNYNSVILPDGSLTKEVLQVLEEFNHLLKLHLKEQGASVSKAVQQLQVEPKVHIDRLENSTMYARQQRDYSHYPPRGWKHFARRRTDLDDVWMPNYDDDDEDDNNGGNYNRWNDYADHQEGTPRYFDRYQNYNRSASPYMNNNYHNNSHQYHNQQQYGVDQNRQQYGVDQNRQQLYDPGLYYNRPPEKRIYTDYSWKHSNSTGRGRCHPYHNAPRSRIPSTTSTVTTHGEHFEKRSTYDSNKIDHTNKREQSPTPSQNNSGKATAELSDIPAKENSSGKTNELSDIPVKEGSVTKDCKDSSSKSDDQNSIIKDSDTTTTTIVEEKTKEKDFAEANKESSLDPCNNEEFLSSVINLKSSLASSEEKDENVVTTESNPVQQDSSKNSMEFDEIIDVWGVVEQEVEIISQPEDETPSPSPLDKDYDINEVSMEIDSDCETVYFGEAVPYESELTIESINTNSTFLNCNLESIVVPVGPVQISNTSESEETTKSSKVENSNTKIDSSGCVMESPSTNKERDSDQSNSKQSDLPYLLTEQKSDSVHNSDSKIVKQSEKTETKPEELKPGSNSSNKIPSDVQSKASTSNNDQSLPNENINIAGAKITKRRKTISVLPREESDEEESVDGQNKRKRSKSVDPPEYDKPKRITRSMSRDLSVEVIALSPRYREHTKLTSKRRSRSKSKSKSFTCCSEPSKEVNKLSIRRKRRIIRDSSSEDSDMSMCSYESSSSDQKKHRRKKGINVKQQNSKPKTIPTNPNTNALDQRLKIQTPSASNQKLPQTPKDLPSAGKKTNVVSLTEYANTYQRTPSTERTHTISPTTTRRMSFLFGSDDSDDDNRAKWSPRDDVKYSPELGTNSSEPSSTKSKSSKSKTTNTKHNIPTSSKKLPWDHQLRASLDKPLEKQHNQPKNDHPKQPSLPQKNKKSIESDKKTKPVEKRRPSLPQTDNKARDKQPADRRLSTGEKIAEGPSGKLRTSVGTLDKKIMKTLEQRSLSHTPNNIISNNNKGEETVEITPSCSEKEKVSLEPLENKIVKTAEKITQRRPSNISFSEQLAERLSAANEELSGEPDKKIPKVIEQRSSSFLQSPNGEPLSIEKPQSVASEASDKKKIKTVKHRRSSLLQAINDEQYLPEKPQSVASESSDKNEIKTVKHRRPSLLQATNGEQLSTEKPQSVASESSDKKIKTVKHRRPSLLQATNGEQLLPEKPQSVASESSDKNEIKTVKHRRPSLLQATNGEQLLPEKPQSMASESSDKKEMKKIKNKRPSLLLEATNGEQLLLEKPLSMASESSDKKEMKKIKNKRPSLLLEATNGEQLSPEKPQSVASMSSDTNEIKTIKNRRPSLLQATNGEQLSTERPVGKEKSSNSSDAKVGKSMILILDNIVINQAKTPDKKEQKKAIVTVSNAKENHIVDQKRPSVEKRRPSVHTEQEKTSSVEQKVQYALIGQLSDQCFLNSLSNLETDLPESKTGRRCKQGRKIKPCDVTIMPVITQEVPVVVRQPSTDANENSINQVHAVASETNMDVIDLCDSDNETEIRYVENINNLMREVSEKKHAIQSSDATTSSAVTPNEETVATPMDISDGDQSIANSNTENFITVSVPDGSSLEPIEIPVTIIVGEPSNIALVDKPVPVVNARDCAATSNINHTTAQVPNTAAISIPNNKPKRIYRKRSVEKSAPGARSVPLLNQTSIEKSNVAPGCITPAQQVNVGGGTSLTITPITSNCSAMPVGQSNNTAPQMPSTRYIEQPNLNGPPVPTVITPAQQVNVGGTSLTITPIASNCSAMPDGQSNNIAPQMLSTRYIEQPNLNGPAVPTVTITPIVGQNLGRVAVSNVEQAPQRPVFENISPPAPHLRQPTVASVANANYNNQVGVGPNNNQGIAGPSNNQRFVGPVVQTVTHTQFAIAFTLTILVYIDTYQMTSRRIDDYRKCGETNQELALEYKFIELGLQQKLKQIGECFIDYLNKHKVRNFQLQLFVTYVRERAGKRLKRTDLTARHIMWVMIQAFRPYANLCMASTGFLKEVYSQIVTLWHYDLEAIQRNRLAQTGTLMTRVQKALFELQCKQYYSLHMALWGNQVPQPKQPRRKGSVSAASSVQLRPSTAIQSQPQPDLQPPVLSPLLQSVIQQQLQQLQQPSVQSQQHPSMFSGIPQSSVQSQQHPSISSGIPQSSTQSWQHPSTSSGLPQNQVPQNQFASSALQHLNQQVHAIPFLNARDMQANVNVNWMQPNQNTQGRITSERITTTSTFVPPVPQAQTNMQNIPLQQIPQRSEYTAPPCSPALFNHYPNDDFRIRLPLSKPYEPPRVTPAPASETVPIPPAAQDTSSSSAISDCIDEVIRQTLAAGTSNSTNSDSVQPEDEVVENVIDVDKWYAENMMTEDVVCMNPEYFEFSHFIKTDIDVKIKTDTEETPDAENNQDRSGTERAEPEPQQQQQQLIANRSYVRIASADSGFSSPPRQIEHPEILHGGRITCICFKKAELACECRIAIYCSKECQSKDWENHKEQCLRVREANQSVERFH